MFDGRLYHTDLPEDMRMLKMPHDNIAISRSSKPLWNAYGFVAYLLHFLPQACLLCSLWLKNDGISNCFIVGYLVMAPLYTILHHLYPKSNVSVLCVVLFLALCTIYTAVFEVVLFEALQATLFFILTHIFNFQKHANLRNISMALHIYFVSKSFLKGGTPVCKKGDDDLLWKAYKELNLETE